MVVTKKSTPPPGIDFSSEDELQTNNVCKYNSMIWYEQWKQKLMVFSLQSSNKNIIYHETLDWKPLQSMVSLVLDSAL